MNDGYILMLDGSTEVCSVALSSADRKLMANVFESTKSKQSECLAPMVHEVLGALPRRELLKAVIVAEGPGSYTGLRIVAGFTKGLCMAMGLPLYTITTTELLSHTFLWRNKDVGPEAILMPMIDARRMEVYASLHDAKGKALTTTQALILTEREVQDAIAQELLGREAYFFGSGAEKAQELFGEICPSAQFIPNILPDVAALVDKAWELVEGEGEPRDITYWEPFYLKEYEAKVGMPNKVLGR